MPSVGVFFWDPNSYSHEFQRKPLENSEWLGQQVQPGIEPGTFHLPVLSAEPLWNNFREYSCFAIKINKTAFV